MIVIIFVCVFLGDQGIPLHSGQASCSWKSSDTSVNKENEILENGVNENASKKVSAVFAKRVVLEVAVVVLVVISSDRSRISSSIISSYCSSSSSSSDSSNGSSCSCT